MRFVVLHEFANLRTRQWRPYRNQAIAGNIGLGFLTSFHPTEGDRPTGRAISPEFIVTLDQYLVFLIARGKGESVGMRLLADDEEVTAWRGQNPEWFYVIVHPLADVAGNHLGLEILDDEIGGWGHS